MKNLKDEITAVYTKPLLELVATAYKIHGENFATDIELCELISVKTGGCPEDCGYCAQSIKYSTAVENNPLLPLEIIKSRIEEAKANGASRVCLGAGYRSPNQRALNTVIEYVKLIKENGLEACATLGGLSETQAQELKQAGLDYYNHNIDTSPEYYFEVVTTRSFNDRLATIENVAKAGLKVCCGGIIGMGESRADRISFIAALLNMPALPDSIPVNCLVPVDGTPLASKANLDKIELIRLIATLRIYFPITRIRLSAGRNKLSDAEQAFCFMAGANSIFCGEKLLTTPNISQSKDQLLFAKLGLNNASTSVE